MVEKKAKQQMVNKIRFKANSEQLIGYMHILDFGSEVHVMYLRM